MARGKRKERDELDELSRLLLDLRERADLTQPAVAERLNISQSMVSRFESGRGIPEAAVARKLAQVYKATPEERRRLIELVAVMEPARLDSRLVMQRGKTLAYQERIRQIEHSCSLVRAYQPGMVLGMLQTPAYARAVFTQPRPGRPARSDSPTALAASRAARYRALTEEAGRRWVLIQTEGALNWHIGSPEVMAEQMDQLVAASRLPHVRLGVIPARTRTHVVAQHGFHLYDSRGVQVGTKTATSLSNDECDITEYEALFAELEAIAVFDEEARKLIDRIANEYRRLT